MSEFYQQRMKVLAGPQTRNRQQFINAMSAVVTGVNILTTDGEGGRFAMTVSAVSSVSADPPMILACINRRSPVRDAVIENGCFCINALSSGQQELADVFSGRSNNAYDFRCAKWGEGITGAPILVDALSSFDCSVTSSLESGSHTIFIGEVDLAINRGGTPLLYTNRRYGYPIDLQ